MLAFNVNTNSMNVNAFDLGLISKDNNIGSIDTDSLFNCVGAAITCDNDNTVNNNVAINNGTNGEGNTPLPPIDPILCEECISNTELLSVGQLIDLSVALTSDPGASYSQICEAIDAIATVEDLVVILNEVGLTAEEIVALLSCLEIEITLAEVIAIVG